MGFFKSKSSTMSDDELRKKRNEWVKAYYKKTGKVQYNRTVPVELVEKLDAYLKELRNDYWANKKKN